MSKLKGVWKRIDTVKVVGLLRDYLLIVAGTAVLALGLHLFYLPNQLATGGLTGYAQIVNQFTGWPIGVMVFIGNLPLFYLGWRYLGGRRFLVRTIFGAAAFSVMIDGLAWLLPPQGLTQDFLLNALYGGLMTGLGAGLVLRAKATTGGTDILARFLNRRYGVPLSTSYLYTDGLVVFLAAFVFSWEHALYAILALYVSGRVAEVTASGANVERVALIVSESPERVAQAILNDLDRGVTRWMGQGGYTGRERPLLMCVISRAEVVQLKTIIHESDPAAFVIIGLASEVLGEGFRPLVET